MSVVGNVRCEVFQLVGVAHPPDPGLSGLFISVILLTRFNNNLPDARDRTVQVSLISFNAREGDAIGLQVVTQANFFRERGSSVRVYVQQTQAIHPDLEKSVQAIPDGLLSAEEWEYLQSSDLIIAQYGQHYELLDHLPGLVRAKPRILVDYHGVTPPHLWGTHNNKALVQGVRRRDLLWFADAILTHSDFTTNELKRFGIPAGRIWKVRYAIDLPELDQERSRNRFRQRMGFREQRVLLYVGRFAANKRVPLLVESLKSLVSVGEDAHLCLVGDTSDLYQQELEKVATASADYELSDRVHVLGHLVGTALYDAFCGSDVFVTASEWESFCIPLVEAMHFGLPVVGARATAIPGTIANDGLTFSLNNASELADVLVRMNEPGSVIAPAGNPSEERKGVPALRLSHPTSKPTIGIVIDDGSIVNGVTNSLKTMARSLVTSGHTVEVFVSGKPKGNESDEFRGAKVSFYQPESGRPEVVQEITRGLQHSRWPTPEEQERYLDSLPSSPSLVDAVRSRTDELSAVIVGPYLSRLSAEVVEACPEKTLLVPCFHDERQAHWPMWPSAYRRVGGFLFHSQTEADFAHAQLGFNHPNSEIVETFLDAPKLHANLPRRLQDRRYLVYCGRYIAEKNVPLLLEWAERYQAAHPDRWQFVFIGSGSIAIPKAKWAFDLGVVSREYKDVILGHADALIQLSCNESLSLVALEAWQQSTPVIGHQDCEVLREHMESAEGGSSGWLVTDYRSFAGTLNSVWENEDIARVAGVAGRRFVESKYRDQQKFTAKIEQAVDRLSISLAEQMRRRGVARATQYSPLRWRETFTEVVERILHQTPREPQLALEVRRRVAKRKVPGGTPTYLLPTRIRNWGEYPVVPDGPMRVELCSQAMDPETSEPVTRVMTTTLPKTVAPGQTISAAVRVRVPEAPGKYHVRLWARLVEGNDEVMPPRGDKLTSTMKLLVTGQEKADSHLGCSVLMDHVHDDIQEAEELQKLPDDYLDVTQGTLAKLKRRIKHKLLNNFKVAYVDVLSRQQSAFNQQILNVVKELAECCALLDHAVEQLQQQVNTASQSLPKRVRQRQ